MSLGVVSFSPGKPPIKLSNLNMIGVIMWEPDATQAAVKPYLWRWEFLPV